MLIHDSLDEGIFIEDANLLYEAAKQPKKLWVVDNANHTGAYDTQPDEYKQRVLSFLNRTG